MTKRNEHTGKTVARSAGKLLASQVNAALLSLERIEREAIYVRAVLLEAKSVAGSALTQARNKNKKR